METVVIYILGLCSHPEIVTGIMCDKPLGALSAQGGFLSLSQRHVLAPICDQLP